MSKRKTSGANAKATGHINENRIAATLNEEIRAVDDFKVDGASNTKIDILNSKARLYYSVKSVSGKNTQCHLTSTYKWIDYFKIRGNTKTFIEMFFGGAGKDASDWGTVMSDKEIRQNRIYAENIPSNIIKSAVKWFNENKMAIFDIIIVKGMFNTPVNHMIWHTKSDDMFQIIEIKNIRELVKTGKWSLNNTTLEFRTKDGDKLFHLQMKGSGTKYTNGYHGMMFHVYDTVTKCCKLGKEKTL